MREQIVRCDVCQREAGPGMIDCPNRTAGTCPFTVSEEPLQPPLVGILLMLIALPFIALPLFGARQEPAVWLCMLPFLVAGGGLFLLGAHLLVGQRTVLRHADSGVYWMRVASVGLETRREMITQFTPLDLNLSPVPPLTYPASVSGLLQSSRRERSATLFAATLCVLLAQDVVRLYLAPRYTSRFGGKLREAAGYRDGLRLKLGTNPNVDGVLENKIVQAVRAAGVSGITVYGTIYTMFAMDVALPDREFMSWVWRDAVTRNLADSKSFGRFSLNEAGQTALARDYAGVHSLYEHAATHNAVVIESIKKEMRRAIDARVIRSEVDA